MLQLRAQIGVKIEFYTKKFYSHWDFNQKFNEFNPHNLQNLRKHLYIKSWKSQPMSQNLCKIDQLVSLILAEGSFMMHITKKVRKIQHSANENQTY